MEGNQFTVYQLKQIPETRSIRFRTYQTLLDKGIPIQYENYKQVYLGTMQLKDTPGSIKMRFSKQLPRTFKGHSISTSDVLVLNQNGVVTAYYVDKDGFFALTGFIQNGTSGALISIETREFHLEGKSGSWLAIDSLIIDGREFFLMQHEKYGADGAYIVLDEAGKLVADSVYTGFDQKVQQQIREYLNPPAPVPEFINQSKPPLEDWQKYMENGEYLRSSEMSEEQNYNMIDGRRNNTAPRNGKKTSVLVKLHQKQARLAKSGGKSVTQRASVENVPSADAIERRRN